MASGGTLPEPNSLSERFRAVLQAVGDDARMTGALVEVFTELEARLDEVGRQNAAMAELLAQLVRRAERDHALLQGFLTSRQDLVVETEPDDQTSMQFEPGKPSAQIGPTIDDIIRAANFPDSVDDFAAVNAIRQALKNRNMAQLLQAAEDMLNLLAQDGIYVDDLHVAHSAPAQWRAFAQGKRGPVVSSVGAIHDEDVIERTKARARRDQIFRDTALHFQRRFDTVLGDFVQQASDADIQALAATRSGRAFMLMARVSGTFD
jgi:hypothetical protein